jgi:hypothetical protein
MAQNIYLDQKIIEVLEIARQAPSVHNTQPWLVNGSKNVVKVSINNKYKLVDGDPTGRQTIISMGIFCEAICLAAEKFGFAEFRTEIKDKSAEIHFKRQNNIAKSTDQKIKLLKKRCTDRSIYKPVEISSSIKNTIENINHNEGIGIELITDKSIIIQIAILTSKGIKLALSNPAFRIELSRYLILPKTKKRRGISIKSLYLPWMTIYFEPILVRLGLVIGAEAKLEKRRWLSASGVVAIFGDGDLNNFWFETGRTYLRVSLAIEQLGLSQATSAAIVEASNYHEDIEKSLNSNQRVLALIRIGKGRKKRFYSPRVNAEELITSHQLRG